MKKNILILLFCLSFLSCKKSVEQPKSTIYGVWVIDDLIALDSNQWLRELSLPNWSSLEINLELSSSNVVNMKSQNSPDSNIFPESSEWTLDADNHDIQIYTGLINGVGIEDSNKRIYYLSLQKDNLEVSTLVEPDCPQDTVCTLEICCDVQFRFIRQSL